MDGHTNGASHHSALIDALIAEFRVVAGEIVNRSQAQHVLLNISLVGAGATAAFVVAAPDRAIFALVLTFVSSFLGALWIDHARVIASKGIYISSNLWPQMRERLRVGDLPSHEEWTRRQDSNRVAWLAFVTPLIGIFVLPAIGGLVFSFSSVRSTGSWIAWGMGIAVTSLALAYWIAYYYNHTVLTYIGPSYQPAPRDPQMPPPPQQAGEPTPATRSTGTTA